MLTIADPERYARHRAARTQSTSATRELLLPIALFGCIGAIAWAIRGTNGWNGIDGTIVPGTMWGILWWYCCARKGIRANSAPLWLGLGIAVGGELGYGIYVSWIRGMFQHGATNEIIHIAPWKGWLWFFICGIGWGAPGGICLGWALSTKRSLRIWIPRILIPFAAYHATPYIIHAFPQLFLPNYDLVNYANEADDNLGRIIWTQTMNAKALFAWIAAMGVAFAQRDKTSYTINAIIGGGFGPGFMIAALWCLGYASDTHATFIDWWKIWELNAGLFLGALYALALCWSIRELDTRYDAQGNPLSEEDVTHSAALWNVHTAWEAIGVVILTMTIFYENSFRTSVAMSALFVSGTTALIMQTLNGLTPQQRDLSRARLAQTFCVFLFIFVTWHGFTSTLGVALGTHTAEIVDQYAWPIQRQWLFAPIGLLIVAGTLLHMTRISRGRHEQDQSQSLPARITSLLIALGLVGVISIWNLKLAILYALFLCATLIAFLQLNRRFDRIDQQQPEPRSQS